MKTVAIIPARYHSSRLKGKPLADICGKPMVWWVYSRVRQSKKIDAVYVATDSEEIKSTCEQHEIPCILTSPEHATSTERLYEAAQAIPADVYLCINGDEPLIESALVEQVIPEQSEGFFAANLMTKIESPAEAVDESNIKVVADVNGNALFFSRSPIPHPKASLQFDYYKHLGVLAYSLEALRFFSQTPKGPVEKVEDINELRFLEHGRPIRMVAVNAHTLSVDTQKDLEYVRDVIARKLERGELTQ